MGEAPTDELIRTGEAFAGNGLLATFSPDERVLLEPFGEMVELRTGDLVLRRGEQVDSSLFPVGATMVSMILDLKGGRYAEVASIGQEGAVGGIISCGHVPAYTRAEVLVPGLAFRLPMTALEQAKNRSPFVENLFCRYSDYLLAQVMQSVVCNAYHSIAERAARWLLHAQDRAGDRIELTQEAFAGLLGVQRTTLNAVIGELSAENLISTGRGRIHVTDRAGLRHRTCECYEQLKEHFVAIIGPTGRGAE